MVTNSTDTPVGTYSLEIRAYDPCNLFCSAVIVVTVSDTTAPEWNVVPLDQILEFEEALSYQLDASDLSGLGLWQLNDSVHFLIVDGLITSIGTLAPGTYGLNVTVEDIYGNTLFAVFYVTVNEEVITTTTTTTTSETTSTTTSSTTSITDTTTTSTGPDDANPLMMVIGGIAFAGVVIVAVIVFLMKQKKAT